MEKAIVYGIVTLDLIAGIVTILNRDYVIGGFFVVAGIALVYMYNKKI